MDVTRGMKTAGKVDRGLAGGRRGRKGKLRRWRGEEARSTIDFCTKMSLCDDACTMTTHNGNPKDGRSGG